MFFVQLVTDLVPTFQHVREHGLADNITQSGLGGPADCALIVGDIQGRLLRVQTFQNSTASTLTGTVSLVRVFSALNEEVMTRVSIQ